MNTQHQQLALQAKRQELFNHFYEWPIRKATTALMIVNNVAGTIAMQHNALTLRGLQVMRRGMNWLRSLSRCGQAQAVFALTGTSTMAKKYWAGLASSHRATLRAISSELEELGLFKIVSPGYQNGYNSHTKQHKRREYHEVCLATLLVAHEQLEEVLEAHGVRMTEAVEFDSEGRPFPPDPDIPAHHAQWGRVLFNAYFEGVAKYRRGESAVGSIEGAEAFEQAWGVYGLDEQELEGQAEVIPDNRDLGEAFQGMIDQLGAGVLALVEQVCGRHPEWELHLDGDEVTWLPF